MELVQNLNVHQNKRNKEENGRGEFPWMETKKMKREKLVIKMELSSLFC